MLQTSVITYLDEEQMLEGFIACPKESKRPLVLLCHAWSGRDTFICQKAEAIAALGYVGFAIDMYGPGVVGKSNDENAALKRPFMEDRNFLKRRLLKGFEAACAHPQVDTTQVIALGFGFGGICALDLARSGVNLRGAISVYGHFDPPKHVNVKPIRAKILLLHGYNDPISTMSELLAFQKELDREKVDWQSGVYSSTLHAFANPSANDPAAGIAYHSLSAQRAWKAIEIFLAELCPL